jgi:hypothetical protein
VCAEQTTPTEQEQLARGSSFYELTPEELKGFASTITLVPIVASGFAVAFNVGYFLAYDISWLPFFSLSEHVVFALRALPIAIAAAVTLLVAIKYPPKFFSGRRWTIVLVIAAAMAVLDAHLGLGVVFTLVAVGARKYRKLDPKNPIVDVLYFGTSMMLLTLMLGYLSAVGGRSIWEIEKKLELLDYSLARNLFTAPSMCVYLTQNGTSAPPKRIGPFVGLAIFVGSNAVLFHQYGFGARDAQLLKLDGTQLQQCSSDDFKIAVKEHMNSL